MVLVRRERAGHWTHMPLSGGAAQRARLRRHRGHADRRITVHPDAGARATLQDRRRGGNHQPVADRHQHRDLRMDSGGRRQRQPGARHAIDLCGDAGDRSRQERRERPPDHAQPERQRRRDQLHQPAERVLQGLHRVQSGDSERHEVRRSDYRVDRRSWNRHLRHRLRRLPGQPRRPWCG
jgi:hypothetical protein